MSSRAESNRRPRRPGPGASARAHAHAHADGHDDAPAPARAHQRAPRADHPAGRLAAAALTTLAAGTAWLGPAVPAARADVPGVSGETVVYGDVTFIRDGNQLWIQASDGSIIDYASFNIAAGEIVQFMQPGSTSRVLNRILGVGPSEIDGQLLANGIVYIVNPAGVIFGAGSVIDVGGIYASAASISNADFLAGIDQFTNAAGDVVNHGSIQASRVHLLGQHVRNFGDISAPGGVVTMLAGDSFLLGEVGGQLLVRVDGRDLGNEPAGPSGVMPSITADAGVLNAGTIDVGDGEAYLAAGDLFALGVHNLGTINASGGGVTAASGDGVVYNSGTIDVSNAGEAGWVRMRAPSIVNGGLISAASSDGQAGTIELLGHDHVYLLDGSVTTAGGGSGLAHGGTILMIASDGLAFVSEGSLVDVSGGAAGGDGGFVETSGAELVFEGTFDLGAAAGWDPGLVFIDPLNIIVGLDGSDDAQLDGNTITFLEGGAGNTSLISVFSLAALNGNILLQAINDITLDVLLDLSANSNSITFEAQNGDVIFNAGITGATGLTVSAGDSIQFQAGVDFDIAGLIDLTAISILADGSLLGQGITIDGDITFDSGSNAAQVLDARTGALSVTGAIVKSDGGLLTLGGATGITVDGSITTDVGGLDVEDALTLDGDVSVAANARFRESVTLTTVGDQSLDAVGTMSFDDTLEKTGAGELAVSGSTITLAAGAESAGAMELTGAVSTAGDLDAAGDLDVVGTLAFTAAGGNASATSGGTLAITGDVTRGSGNLRLEGTTGVVLSGGVTVTAGNLTVDGLAQIAADVTAGGDILFIDPVTLTAVGLQTITAGGTLEADGTIGKAAGDLVLDATAINLDAASGVSVGAGSLTLDGAVNAAGGITASGDIDVTGALVLDGAGTQTVDAGGTLDVNGAVSKAAGNLVLRATVIDLASGVTVTAGDLDLDGAVELLGNLSAGGDLILGGDVSFNGAGLQTVTAGDTLQALGTLAKGAGNLTLTGTAIDLDGAGGVDLDAGSLTLDGAVTTVADLVASGAITVDGSLTLDGAGAQAVTAGTGLSVSGLVLKSLGDLELDGGTLIDLGGTLTVTTGQLTLSSLAELAGDVTAASIVFAADVDFDAVGGLQTVTAAGGIEFDGDATRTGGNLRLAGPVDAAGDLTGDGSITLTGPLALSSAGVQTVDAATTLTVDGAITKLTGNLVLVGGTLVDLGSAATISAGDLTVDGLAEITANLDASGAITFLDAVSFTGLALQVVTADSLDVAGNVTKAAGDLRFTATAIDLDGGVAVTLGDFDLQGLATIFGDVTAGGDISLDDLVTLDGAATQQILSGGVLTITGGIVKNAGDLVLAGTTSIDADGTVTVTEDLSASGGDWNQTAQVGGATIDVAMDGTATISGDLLATGMLRVRSGLDGTGDLSVGAAALQGAMIVLEAGDGAGGATGARLIFAGGATLAGAGGGGQPTSVVLRQDADLAASDMPGAGQFTGGVAGLDLTLESRDGDVTLDAAAGLAGTQLTVAAAGDLTATVALALQSLTASVGAGGTATFEQSLATTGGVDITGDLALENGLSVAALDVSGDLALGGAGDWTYTVTGDADVGGTLTIGGSGTRQVDVGGDLDLGAADLGGTGATAITAAGDFTVTGAIDGTGAGGRTLTAGGTLQVGGAMQLDAGDVVLVGSLIDLDGLVDIAGALSLDGLTRASANITAGTSIAFLADLVLDSAGVQVLSAGTLIMADGTVTKVQGDLQLLAPQVTLAGTLVAGDDLVLAGDLDAQAVDIGADLQLTGAGAQTLSASQLDVAGDLTAGGAGLLLIDAPAVIGGDVTTTGDVTFGQALTLSAAGAQQLTTGGTLRLQGDVAKAAGTLTLDGATLTLVEGDVSAGGNLLFAGPTTLDLGGGTVEAGGLVTFIDTLAVTGDALVRSTGGGDVVMIDAVTGSGGLRVTTTGDTRFLSTVNLGWLETAGGGRTLVSADVTTSGRQDFQERVVVLGDLAFRSTGGGEISFGDTLTGAAGVTVDTAGDTRFEGTVAVDELLATGGGLTFLLAEGITTAGTLTILDELRLTGDALLQSTGGATVRLGGGVLGLGHDLRIETAGQTRLEGTIRTARLETDAAGTLALGADITVTGGLDLLESTATLVGDTIIRDTSGGPMRIGFSVDGTHDLELVADGDLTVLGEIGSTTRLDSFTARTPGILRLEMAAIRTVGDIRLNPDGRDDVPTAATIVAPGSIRFDALTGDFVMGVREKLTVLGTVDIALAGASAQAILSDITSLGDMNVTAAQILLQLRETGFLLDQFGLLSADADNGLDFVTGGVFRFSVAPMMIGNGNLASFASEDGLGDVNGTLTGFFNQSFGEPISEDDLISLVDGTILDLRASGPTNANLSEAFASAIPRDDQIASVPQALALGATEIERLRNLRIRAERPADEEYVRNTEEGASFYDDVESLGLDVPEVTVNRLLNDRVRDVLARFERLLATGPADPGGAGGGAGSPGGAAPDRREVVKVDLRRARIRYPDADPATGAIEPEAFVQYLDESGQADVVDFLAGMSDLLDRIAGLGLTSRESQTVRDQLVGEIRPENLSVDQVDRMLEAAASRRRSG